MHNNLFFSASSSDWLSVCCVFVFLLLLFCSSARCVCVCVCCSCSCSLERILSSERARAHQDYQIHRHVFASIKLCLQGQLGATRAHAQLINWAIWSKHQTHIHTDKRYQPTIKKKIETNHWCMKILRFREEKTILFSVLIQFFVGIFDFFFNKRKRKRRKLTPT